VRLAVILPPAEPTTRERLTTLLDAMAYGLFPQDGSAPSPQAAEDIAALGAGITAVEAAQTEAGMLAAYAGCLLALAGDDPARSLAEVKRAGSAEIAEGVTG
jgi:hypothetical protein